MGLNFGTLGSTSTPATTSASGGFGTSLFGSKPATGFTLGGTSTGKGNRHILRELVWDIHSLQVLSSVSSLYKNHHWGKKKESSLVVDFKK